MISISPEKIDMLARIYLTSESRLAKLGWGYFKRYQEEDNNAVIYLISPEQLEKAQSIEREYGRVEYSDIDDKGGILRIRPRILISEIDSLTLRVEFLAFPYEKLNVDRFSRIFGTKDYILLQQQFIMEFKRKVMEYMAETSWVSLDIIFTEDGAAKKEFDEFVDREAGARRYEVSVSCGFPTYILHF